MDGQGSGYALCSAKLMAYARLDDKPGPTSATMLCSFDWNQSMPYSPEKELIRFLGLAASYNDKGWMWRNDSRAKQDETLKEFQSSLTGLVEKIGAINLPPQLLQAIRSEEAVQDSSGQYRELAESFFSASRRL